MALKILPYKAGSESAKALAAALQINKLKQEGSRWSGSAKDTLINWGVSRDAHPAFQGHAKVLNNPAAVSRAANKLLAFQYFMEGDVKTPKWTTSSEEATIWLAAGATVVKRTILNGHSGEGIEIITPELFLRNGGVGRGRLYTNYIKKVEEYRIHVFNGQAFFVQRKARKLAVPDDEVNWQVRNHANGFIFAHQNVEVPQEAKDEAIKAVKALGLDFGAVDLLLTKRGSWYVLEVNTACGLEGETLARYTEQFAVYK